MTIPEKKSYPRVLTIAGSDSGGGAGIQADIKTISANGCYAASVITALTAQNTTGVKAVHPVPVDFVRQQLDAVLGDIGADVVKIGMLFSSQLVEVVAERLAVYDITKIVLDPVMVATSGDSLLAKDAVDSLQELLLPVATLVTPNLPEAERLLGSKITTAEEMEEAARALCRKGCSGILVKGGHLAAEDRGADDCLWLGEEGRAVWLPSPRVPTKNTHGTGCTLSSAIAASLAKGFSLEQSVVAAKKYIAGAIDSGAIYQLGEGCGPVDHLWQSHKRG